jgi:integrase
MGKRTRANGQGTAYKLPNGKYRVEKTIYQNGSPVKRYTKSGFKLKRDAMDYLNKLNAGAIKDTSTATFKELYDIWSVPHYEKVSSDTSNGYKAAYKKCEPLWFRQFASLKAADLQGVVDACKQSRRTKADIKSLIAILYKYAITNDYCDKDYSQFIKLPKKEMSKKDAFTKEEIGNLWTDYNAGNEFAGYILIMIYTGMRYGEISKLTRENIDIESRCITGAGIKSEAGRKRVIPIADCIFSILQKLYDKTDKKILAMHEKIFYNDFQRTLERLGIRNLKPHCCRHTTGTALAEQNVPIAVILAIMGHTKYSTTLGYTHISLEELLKAVNKIPSKPSGSAE